MSELFHILYVDINSDELQIEAILNFFNPPQNLPIELIKKINKGKKYTFLFTYARDYQEALQRLLYQNFDPLQRKKGILPFDTVLFEYQRQTKKLSGLDFIAEISQIGILRLGLTKGFLAFGPSISDAEKRILTLHGVRQYIDMPFTLEELEANLKNYLKILSGSRYLYIEDRPEQREGKPSLVRRIVRYINRNDKVTGIHLPPLERDLEENFYLLRETNREVVLGEFSFQEISEAANYENLDQETE